MHGTRLQGAGMLLPAEGLLLPVGGSLLPVDGDAIDVPGSAVETDDKTGSNGAADTKTSIRLMVKQGPSGERQPAG